jgi:hypothetical protein
MPINIGSEGAPFNTQVPGFDENADIQTAFKLYHYGEDNLSGTGTIAPNSLAGYLKKLQDDKIEKAPSIIPANADLDTYTVSGFYAQNTNAKALTGTNYPIKPARIGFPYAGLLRVVNDGFNIYQEYQMAGLEESQTYWRAFFGSLGWTPWRTFAEEGHIHDDRYFTKQQSDNRYLPAIKYLNIRKPNIQNNLYTLTFADESSLILIDNLSLPNSVIIPNNSSVPFITGTQISVMQGNTGRTSFQGAAGVTVRFTPGNRLRGIWSSAALIKIDTNEWVVVGDLS